MLRIGLVFFIIFASAIIGLVFGSEQVRWFMAALLALVAGPLWVVIKKVIKEKTLSEVVSALLPFGSDNR